MKKNLMTVLILALLIVNLAVSGVMMFSVIGTNKKTADLVGNIATVLNLELSDGKEEEEVKEVPLKNSETYTLEEPLTIPLKREGTKDKYIQFTFSLYMDKKSKGYKEYGGEKITERVSMIKDLLNSLVAAHTESDFRDNMDGIIEEILQALQDMFESDFIYKVAISDVKYM